MACAQKYYHWEVTYEQETVEHPFTYLYKQSNLSPRMQANKQEMQPEIAHMYTKSDNSLRVEQNRTNRTIVYKPSIAKK